MYTFLKTCNIFRCQLKGEEIVAIILQLYNLKTEQLMSW